VPLAVLALLLEAFMIAVAVPISAITPLRGPAATRQRSRSTAAVTDAYPRARTKTQRMCVKARAAADS
jgi:hypothetical protein